MIKLGAIIPLNKNVCESMQKLRDLGLETCQLRCWEPDEFYTDEMAELVLESCKKTGIVVSEMWTGYSGPLVWDFKEGPLTLGLVPSAMRYKRLAELKAGADFAVKIGVKDIITHVGFIPEVAYSTEYRELVAILRDLVSYCKERDLYFNFETGQETPTTLVRTIKDIGMDNIGVNFDPANLISYGKANAVDALDLLGPYVRGVHGKDSEYPTPEDPYELGEETPLCQGKVDYPAFIAKLLTYGYDRSITIEREIEEGDEQTADIIMARDVLKELISK